MLKSLFLVLAIGAFSIVSASAQDDMPQGDNMQSSMDDVPGNQGSDVMLEEGMQNDMNALDQDMGDAPINQDMDEMPVDPGAGDMQVGPDMEAAHG